MKLTELEILNIHKKYWKHILTDLITSDWYMKGVKLHVIWRMELKGKRCVKGINQGVLR